MLKLFLSFILLLPVFLNATEIEVDKNVKNIPSALQKRVISYWEKRAQKQFEETYEYELPYLQYLHTSLWYEQFFQDAPKFSKIIVKKVENINKNKSIIGLLLYPKYNSKNFVFLYDTWVKIDGNWYHKYKDSSLPGS